MTLESWLKAMGAVLILAGASGYGVALASGYKERLGELEQLRQMIIMLKGQILYANAPLGEALDTIGRRSKGSLADFFCRVAKRIETQQGETFCQIWKEEAKNLEGMDKGDKSSLMELGEHLGFMDRDMQERTLLLYLEQLEQRIENMRAHKQEKCRLYTSLGVMGGLFLVILLI